MKSSHDDDDDDIHCWDQAHTIRKKPGIEITLKVQIEGCQSHLRARFFFDPLGRACDVLKTPQLLLLRANPSINLVVCS